MPIELNNENVVLVDSTETALAVASGSAIPAGTKSLLAAGTDGTNARTLLTDTTGALQPALQLDRSGTGTITALAGTVAANTQGCSSVIFNITGTWVATLAVEGTLDGTNWFAVVGLDQSQAAFTTFSATNTRVYVNSGGFRQIRINATAYTSGTANVTWNAGAGGPTVLEIWNTNATSLHGTMRGVTAAGSPPTTAPLLVGGQDGTNIRTLLTDTSGHPAIVGGAANGAAIAAVNPVRVGGDDGTNLIAARMKAASTAAVAADPSLVVTLSPNSVGLSVTNASVGSNGVAIPTSSTQAGGSDGTVLRPILVDASGRQIEVGAAASGAAVAGNPVLVAGSDGTNARTLKTDTTGRLLISQTNSAAISVTIAYDGTLAVAGAQADYFAKGVYYTVPASYTFTAAAFNGYSDDNRVTARVSKLKTLGTWAPNTGVFTAGGSYSSPAFGTWIELEVTTVMGNVNDIIPTITYTNQDGTTGRTAVIAVTGQKLKKNTPVGFKMLFSLQAGDVGVRAVTAITGDNTNTGAITVNGLTDFWQQAMPTAALNFIEQATAGTATVLAGEVLALDFSSNGAATVRRIVRCPGILEAA